MNECDCDCTIESVSVSVSEIVLFSLFFGSFVVLIRVRSENRLNRETGTCIWHHCMFIEKAHRVSINNCIPNCSIPCVMCMLVDVVKVLGKFCAIGLHFSLKTVHMPLDRNTVSSVVLKHKQNHFWYCKLCCDFAMPTMILHRLQLFNCSNCVCLCSEVNWANENTYC